MKYVMNKYLLACASDTPILENKSFLLFFFVWLVLGTSYFLPGLITSCTCSFYCYHLQKMTVSASQ